MADRQVCLSRQLQFTLVTRTRRHESVKRLPDHGVPAPNRYSMVCVLVVVRHRSSPHTAEPRAEPCYKVAPGDRDAAVRLCVGPCAYWQRLAIPDPQIAGSGASP